MSYLLDTPFSIDYSLAERPNHLRLYGGPYTLSVPASPTMFLRKQRHRVCTWETRLSFQPTYEHTEAGTVVWWNYFTHSSLGIRKLGDQRIIRFKPAEGDMIESILEATGDIVLVIECGNEYRFGYRDPTSSETIWIGSVANDVATKTPPVGAPFTGEIPMALTDGFEMLTKLGMMLGLYAFGDRQRCIAPADFAYAEFR